MALSTGPLRAEALVLSRAEQTARQPRPHHQPPRVEQEDKRAGALHSESRQHSAFVGAAIAGAMGADEGVEASRNAADGQVFGAGAATHRVQVPEDRQGLAQRG
jgi:hypothetical protein